MQLLLFSDLHCDKRAAAQLVKLSGDVDVVVGAGDFGNVRRELDEAIGSLSAIDRPAILVPGNAESAEELSAACQAWPTARVLHGSPTMIDGVTFYGVGGGIPITPFGSWSYDFAEDEAAKLLGNCPEGCVLVTHSPPHGILDTSRGRHLGSTAIRDCIQRQQPALAVCGHIHDCTGKTDHLGSTPVVNAGPAGTLWDLEVDVISVRRLPRAMRRKGM